MKELVKEELKLLEAQHPTRYQYLKLQLKEFIHVLEEQEQYEQHQQESVKQKQQHGNSHMSVLTQESSNRKREREEIKDNDGYSKDRRGREVVKVSGAIQKAEACLSKIQILKKSFFRASNH